MKTLSAILAALMVLTAAPASADEVDPHVPNGAAVWCQGGIGGGIAPYCKGAPYADGSYWNQTGHWMGFAPIAWDPPVLVQTGG